jgi:hypothetical protein
LLESCSSLARVLLASSGLSCRGEDPTLQNKQIGTAPPARALAPEHAGDTRQYMERVLSSYSA